jgi:eukaryotic-like serine/threonine-protein kinase
MLARQRGVGGFTKLVALKRILPAMASNEALRLMFLEEARLAARLSHPNVVQIFDLGIDNGSYFIAMEYVPGPDLRTVIRLCTRIPLQLPVVVALRIAADVAAGLCAAHTCTNERGEAVPIVHRDVSPHNILLTREGIAKLTDFGVSKAADSAARTRTGMVKGKVAYMAPEQLEPSIGAFGPRADLFSLGLVLYEMLTLVAPFRLKDDVSSIRAVLKGDVIDPRKLREDIPDSVARLIADCLEQDPARRIASASELRTRLDREQLAHDRGHTSVAAFIEDLVQEALRTGEVDEPTSTLGPGHMDKTSRETPQPSTASGEAVEGSAVHSAVVKGAAVKGAAVKGAAGSRGRRPPRE